MSRLRVPVLLAAAGLVAAACLTINVYFPEAQIKDLSQQIEEAVKKQAAEQAGTETPAPPAEAPKEPGASSSLLDLFLGTTPAYAAEGVAQPEITNPAIRKIIDARASRLGDIDKYKAMGVIGENNQALLEIRNLEAVSDLRARAEVQRLVKAENADREQLFKEIAAAKNVDLSQLPKIRETYAATLRQDARPGNWIQMPDGSWKQK